jgi:hypothetical protein
MDFLHELNDEMQRSMPVPYDSLCLHLGVALIRKKLQLS